MGFLNCLALIIVAFICIYAVINRICECIEKCAQAKAFVKFKEFENEPSGNQTHQTE